jgi:hypothetical protein
MTDTPEMITGRTRMDIQKRRAVFIAIFVSAGFLLIAGQYLRLFLVREGGGGRHFFAISVLIYFAVLSMGCCALVMIHRWRVPRWLKITSIIAAMPLIIWSLFFLAIVGWCVFLVTYFSPI